MRQVYLSTRAASISIKITSSVHATLCPNSAISVQVNSVAVSDHVFQKSPFDLLSLFLCIPFVLMATDHASEDAMHTSLPRSPPLSSNVWFS